MASGANMDDVQKLLEMFAPEELHPDLVIVDFNDYQMVHHPLVVVVPYSEMMNKHINAQFEAKKAALEKAREKKDWDTYVFLHERPYRVDALEEMMFTFEIEHPEKVIAAVWVDSENIYQNFDRWMDIWDYVPSPESVMDKKELAEFNSMPDVIDVFRGTAHVDGVNGMSWTTDRDKAIWFAKRFAREEGMPVLLSGKIKKEDVLAYFAGRNENENIFDVTTENID